MAKVSPPDDPLRTALDLLEQRAVSLRDAMMSQYPNIPPAQRRGADLLSDAVTSLRQACEVLCPRDDDPGIMPTHPQLTRVELSPMELHVLHWLANTALAQEGRKRLPDQDAAYELRRKLDAARARSAHAA